MHLPLTQEHIGDATGLTNVHVNRVLRDLRKEEIVEFHYRRLRIMNPDKLVNVAGIDPHIALSWLNYDSSNEAITHRQRKGDLAAPLHLDAVRRRPLQPASHQKVFAFEGINAA